MSAAPQDAAAVRAALTARLAGLRARGARIEADLATPVSPDSEEAAVERADDEPLAGEGRVLAQEAAEVAAAITRIDAGTYGDCARCGEPIAPARLAAEPEAALCIDCAREVAGD